MKTVQIEYRNKAAIVKLDRGVTNALDLGLIQELAEALQQLRHDSNVNSLVLSSANEKFFCIGFDIPGLFGLSKREFQTFYQAFNRACLDLFTFPKPTVAALTGHAIAGGCILALCCDYRFIAQGRKFMGLNEIKLGVPIPYPADCVLQQLVGAQIAREISYTGEFYQPERLLEMGMVDRILPLDQLLLKAVEKAQLLGAMPGEAFAMIKRSRVQVVEDQILRRLEQKERIFIESWYSSAAREQLKPAMEKF